MVSAIPGLGDVRRLLVVLPTWVGDYVMATPTLRAIRERFPEARVTHLIEPNLRELVRGEHWMDEWLEWPDRWSRVPWRGEFWGFGRRLRTGQFDAVILLPNSARSALIAWLAGIPRRIGYARDGRRPFLTDPIPVRNRIRGGYKPLRLVTYYADLAEAVGCRRPGDDLELHATDECEASVRDRLTRLGIDRTRPMVVMAPGARYGSAKCWFPDRFAKVADSLTIQDGATVVLTCGPGEESIVEAVRSSMKTDGILLDHPRLSLGELKSLVRRSDLLICNDAGLRHFGRAFNVPVVTIFGPTHPEWTATGFPHEQIVRIDVDCGPCQQRECPWGHLRCMKGVEADMVLAAARRFLEARQATRVR